MTRGIPASDRLDSADPARWARAQVLFHAVLEVPPEEREALVESACGSDDRLRDEVMSLLASDRQAGEFIEQPAVALLGATGTTRFMPRFSAGAVLGRYEILDFLGAGGMSEVYRARDSRLGRTVALKLITDPTDRRAGQRLLTEAQNASTLNHPNICGVYEAEDVELPFIVLEYVEGFTLHNLLQERWPSTAEVVRWGKEIAGALDHAHRRGIVHRDLKSANVALAPDGSVKILDFGLSRRIGGSGAVHSPVSILSDASVAGTLTHIAPEVLRGQVLDHRVDVWALGVMLYELTSGRLPFKRATPFETAEAILEATPEPLPSHVPVELQRLIERCLAKDPAFRMGTALELREALGAIDIGDRPAPRRLSLRGRARLGGVLALLAAMLGVAAYRGGWGLLSIAVDAPAPLLAVLPLDDVSSDPAEQFFADGMTEALITELGRIDGVRVISPGTTLRFRNRTTAVRDLAREVGATRVLQGSVARAGDQVRLSVRLIEASTGRLTWTEEYERAERDVQALQATVAEAVARAANVRLTAEDITRLSRVRAVDPDVYESYLKGRYHWNQRTPDSIRTAIEYFQTALRLDPTYAPAHAALADCYNQLGTVMVGGGSPRAWRPRATEAAIKALQIDSDLAEAHATLGYVRHYDWKWDESETSFRRAIALNPSYALARIWYANFLCSRRRLDEAVREVMIARELDPLSLIINTNVGWVLFMARRNDEAIEQFRKTLVLDPAYLQARQRLAGSYLLAGRFQEAIEESGTVARLTNQSLSSLVSLEQAKQLAGRPNEFERLLTELIDGLPSRYVSPGAIANFSFALGRDEKGFEWLDKAHRERSNNIAYLAVEPAYDRVRQDPRFKSLVRSVGLP